MKLAYIYVHGDPDWQRVPEAMAPVARTVALDDQVMIDYGHNGEIFGVEIIDAGKITVSQEPKRFSKQLRWLRQRLRTS